MVKKFDLSDYGGSGLPHQQPRKLGWSIKVNKLRVVDPPETSRLPKVQAVQRGALHLLHQPDTNKPRPTRSTTDSFHRLRHPVTFGPHICLPVGFVGVRGGCDNIAWFAWRPESALMRGRLSNSALLWRISVRVQVYVCVRDPDVFAVTNRHSKAATPPVCRTPGSCTILTAAAHHLLTMDHVMAPLCSLSTTLTFPFSVSYLATNEP
jgi:hypothetical protein